MKNCGKAVVDLECEEAVDLECEGVAFIGRRLKLADIDAFSENIPASTNENIASAASVLSKSKQSLQPSRTVCDASQENQGSKTVQARQRDADLDHISAIENTPLKHARMPTSPSKPCTQMLVNAHDHGTIGSCENGPDSNSRTVQAIENRPNEEARLPTLPAEVWSQVQEMMPQGGIDPSAQDTTDCTSAKKAKTEKTADDCASSLVSPLTLGVRNSSTVCVDPATSVARNHYDSEEFSIQKVPKPDTPCPREAEGGFKVTNKSRFDEEVKALRRNWNVDKLFPAPHIIRKQTSVAPATTGKSFPQRVMIGYIDMWRPYCSHMSARSIELPVGRHANDVASISSVTDVRVPGLKAYESEVIAREMGLDLENSSLYNKATLDDSDYEEYLPDITDFIDRSSYHFEDGTPMYFDIPKALSACIRANLMEARFELSHYPGAENKKKTFSANHPRFDNFPLSVKQTLDREKLEWIKKCAQRIKGLKKLDTTNCCQLRAWIYLAPASFSSNMVSAANFCQLDSAQAHLLPLDGGESLVHKLALSQERNEGSQKVSKPWISVKNQLKLERQWDNLERSAQDGHSRSNLAIVLSALKCHENGYVAPVGKENSTERYRSVLEAKTADGLSTWDSLCYSNNRKKNASLMTKSKTLIDELRSISRENQASISNKASIEGVLSSPTFTVSDRYECTLRQPADIKLPLRRYQLDSLAWMLDQEKKRSISDPFWMSIHCFEKDDKDVTVFYCPMTGTMSRFAPPPVVGGVLAEDMGLGKTIITASLIKSTLEQARSWLWTSTEHRKDLKPSHGTLIVCPASLLKQWQKELTNNVSPRLKVLCWYGSSRTYGPAILASNDVVLTTYGIFSRGSYQALLNVHWFRVIIDESTYLKGGSASCDRELMNLISSRRWAVSGTPFGDDFKKKFLPTMRFIGVSPFARSAHLKQLSGTFTKRLHDPDLLHSLAVPHFIYVMKNIMMRHIKTQKLYGQPLVELPPASGRCVLIDLYPKEKQEYEILETEVKIQARRYLRNTKAFGSHFVQLAQLAQPLRIMADGVLETVKSGCKSDSDTKSEPSMDACRTSRRPGAKVNQLLRDLRQYQDYDFTSKFVVFTEFKEVKLEIKRYLESNGFEVMTLDGTMSATRRGHIIKTFQEDADAAVLVLSMRAGACGLTLTMANVVVLFEVGFKVAIELQAVNRIHRIGQTRPVETLTYVAKGTIDERIVEVRKRRGQPGVVGEDVEGGGQELSTLEVYRAMFAYEE